jgi:hypothetical protein
MQQEIMLLLAKENCCTTVQNQPFEARVKKNFSGKLVGGKSFIYLCSRVCMTAVGLQPTIVAMQFLRDSRGNDCAKTTKQTIRNNYA